MCKSIQNVRLPQSRLDKNLNWMKNKEWRVKKRKIRHLTGLVSMKRSYALSTTGPDKDSIW